MQIDCASLLRRKALSAVPVHEPVAIATPELIFEAIPLAVAAAEAVAAAPAYAPDNPAVLLTPDDDATASTIVAPPTIAESAKATATPEAAATDGATMADKPCTELVPAALAVVTDNPEALPVTFAALDAAAVLCAITKAVASAVVAPLALATDPTSEAPTPETDAMPDDCATPTIEAAAIPVTVATLEAAPTTDAIAPEFAAPVPAPTAAPDDALTAALLALTVATPAEAAPAPTTLAAMPVAVVVLAALDVDDARAEPVAFAAPTLALAPVASENAAAVAVAALRPTLDAVASTMVGPPVLGIDAIAPLAMGANPNMSPAYDDDLSISTDAARALGATSQSATTTAATAADAAFAPNTADQARACS